MSIRAKAPDGVDRTSLISNVGSGEHATSVDQPRNREFSCNHRTQRTYLVRPAELEQPHRNVDGFSRKEPWMVRRIYSVDLPELGCGGVREPWVPFSLIPEVSMAALDGESMNQKFN